MVDDPKVAKKISSFFDAESKSMRNRHEDKGIPPSMRYQIEAILGAKVSTALDVGSGPGSLLKELLLGGLDSAIGLDLSEDMNKVARERLEKEGLLERAELKLGSFLDIQIEEKPEAISMHRVLCCHPDRMGMLKKSVEYKPHLITLSIPRDWKILRLLLLFVGGFAKLTGSFRPYIHSQKSVDQQLSGQNYELISRQKERWWVTSTYRLQGA